MNPEILQVDETTRKLKGLLCRRDIPGYEGGNKGQVACGKDLLQWARAHDFIYWQNLDVIDIYWNEKSALALEIEWGEGTHKSLVPNEVSGS